MIYSTNLEGFTPFDNEHFYRTKFLACVERKTDKNNIAIYYFSSHGKVYALEEMASKTFDYFCITGKQVNSIELFPDDCYLINSDNKSDRWEFDFLNEHKEYEKYIKKIDGINVCEICFDVDENPFENIYGIFSDYVLKSVNIVEFSELFNGLDVEFNNHTNAIIGDYEEQIF